MQTPSLHPLNNTLSYFTQMRGEREKESCKKDRHSLKEENKQLRERERRMQEIESKSKIGVSHKQLGPIRFVLSDC